MSKPVGEGKKGAGMRGERSWAQLRVDEWVTCAKSFMELTFLLTLLITARVRAA
jgi:hypothetical protein